MTDPKARTAASASPITVHVDLISWVNQFVGGSGSGTAEFEEQVPPGSSVRWVLDRLADRFPKLRDTLWDENDRSRIGPHVEVIVNDAILGVHHELDSPLSEGDRITLTGQYIGG